MRTHCLLIGRTHAILKALDASTQIYCDPVSHFKNIVYDHAPKIMRSDPSHNTRFRVMSVRNRYIEACSAPVSGARSGFFAFRMKESTTGNTIRVSRVEADRPPTIAFPRVLNCGPVNIWVP